MPRQICYSRTGRYRRPNSKPFAKTSPSACEWVPRSQHHHQHHTPWVPVTQLINCIIFISRTPVYRASKRYAGPSQRQIGKMVPSFYTRRGILVDSDVNRAPQPHYRSLIDHFRREWTAQSVAAMGVMWQRALPRGIRLHMYVRNYICDVQGQCFVHQTDWMNSSGVFEYKWD